MPCHSSPSATRPVAPRTPPRHSPRHLKSPHSKCIGNSILPLRSLFCWVIFHLPPRSFAFPTITPSRIAVAGDISRAHHFTQCLSLFIMLETLLSRHSRPELPNDTPILNIAELLERAFILPLRVNFSIFFVISHHCMISVLYYYYIIGPLQYIDFISFSYSAFLFRYAS